MAENVTLARPYAEAAFQLASASNALGPWSLALERLAVIAADPQIRAVVRNPHLTAARLAKMLADVAGNLSAEQQNLVKVLAENGRVPVLPEVCDLFLSLKNGHDGTEDAQIASAYPLDDATLKNVVALLEERFKRKMKATVSIDPELIGGVRIAVGDEVIDASVRGKLAAMATALKN